MLSLEKVQFNEKDLIHIAEIELTKQCRLNDIEVRNITAYNKLIHKKVKGFSANYHNYLKDKSSYSIAERQFKELLEHCGLNDFIHEFKVKVRDFKGTNHTYHMDFYFPLFKIAIEINPLFHYTYNSVAMRDKLRAKLLKRKAHIETIDIKVYQKVRKGKLETFIDYEKAFKIIQIILNKRKVHRETLLNFI
jgi:hypothetical protein